MHKWKIETMSGSRRRHRIQSGKGGRARRAVLDELGGQGRPQKGEVQAARGRQENVGREGTRCKGPEQRTYLTRARTSEEEAAARPGLRRHGGG